MTHVQLVPLVASLFAFMACKNANEASTSAASRSEESQPAVCQLTPSQAEVITAAVEFQTQEKVDPKSLPAAELTILKRNTAAALCESNTLSDVSKVFPSVSERLNGGQQNDAATTALALGGTGSSMPGVAYTDYIVMPKTGTRYLAGYNSRGDIIQLLRLLQYRPR